MPLDYSDRKGKGIARANRQASSVQKEIDRLEKDLEYERTAFLENQTDIEDIRRTKSRMRLLGERITTAQRTLRGYAVNTGVESTTPVLDTTVKETEEVEVYDND